MAMKIMTKKKQKAVIVHLVKMAMGFRRLSKFIPPEQWNVFSVLCDDIIGGIADTAYHVGGMKAMDFVEKHGINFTLEDENK